MKKVTLLINLCLALCVTSINAQNPETSKRSFSADIAMWGWLDDGQFTTTSWNMFTVDDNLFEVRYNFDYENALSLYYGHSFSKEFENGGELSFTPALGFTTGRDFSAVGITTHTIYEKNKWKFYSINQYNVGASDLSDNIVYHWIDVTYWLTDWLNIGISEQYYESGNFNNFDIGPSVGFEFGDIYGKIYAWDIGSENAYTGIWIGYYFKN